MSLSPRIHTKQTLRVEYQAIFFYHVCKKMHTPKPCAQRPYLLRVPIILSNIYLHIIRADHRAAVSRWVSPPPTRVRQPPPTARRRRAWLPRRAADWALPQVFYFFGLLRFWFRFAGAVIVTNFVVKCAEAIIGTSHCEDVNRHSFPTTEKAAQIF